MHSDLWCVKQSAVLVGPFPQRLLRRGNQSNDGIASTIASSAWSSSRLAPAIGSGSARPAIRPSHGASSLAAVIRKLLARLLTPLEPAHLHD